MKTIIVGRALRDGKNAIATARTRADTYLINGEWHSAQELAHNAAVEGVNHFGRHTTLKGETVLARVVEGPTVEIQILDIRAVEPDSLTEADFKALGYTDRADYMADWGEIFGNKIWLMHVKRV